MHLATNEKTEDSNSSEGTIMKLIRSKHYLSRCNQCGPMVICSTCGNNCCNAGYGQIDGVKCIDCLGAYKHQDIFHKYPKYIIFAKKIDFANFLKDKI